MRNDKRIKLAKSVVNKFDEWLTMCETMVHICETDKDYADYSEWWNTQCDAAEKYAMSTKDGKASPMAKAYIDLVAEYMLVRANMDPAWANH